MNIEYANFFWYGQSLSLQEYVCISSFVKNGFKVRVYSYNNLTIPEGAILLDASEILPISDLGKYTQAGMSENIPAFADAFRYHLIDKRGGWWFDADVICLTKSEKFAEIIDNKNVKISVGYQTSDIIAIGAIYVDNSAFIKKVLLELEKSGTEFEWGKIGPTLITRVIAELKYTDYVDPINYFYSIHYDDLKRMYDPASLEWCKEKSSNSFALHLWNEFIRNYKIPKNFMPPVGSFLYELYIENCPQFITKPALPFEIVDVLFDHYDIKNDCKRLVEIENKIRNNFIVKNIIKLQKKFK